MKHFLKIAVVQCVIIILFCGTLFAQQDVDNCVNYKNAGDYKRAIESGQRAVRLYFNNVLAHFCLGDSYLMIGEFNLALPEMKEAERLAKSQDELLYIYNRLGLIFYNNGDSDSALLYGNRSLSLARELGNRDMEATQLNNIASILSDKSETDKALSYYEEAQKIRGDKNASATTYTNIALIYKDKGDFDKAISYIKKALEISERGGDYHSFAIESLTLGDTYRMAKDFTRAEEYLNEGLKRIQKIGDKNWEATAYKYIGLLHKDKENLSIAKDYLTKAFDLYTSIGAKDSADDVLYSLNKIKASDDINNCWSLKKSGDYKEAINAGQKAVQQNPSNFDSHFCLGDSYFMNNEIDLALAEFNKAENLTNEKNNLLYTYNKLGLLYDRGKNYDNALSNYNKALPLARELNNTVMQGSILYNIAFNYSSRGETDKAIKYFEDSIQFTPDEERADIYNRIAVAYVDTDDFQKAISYFKKAIEMDDKYNKYDDLEKHTLNLGDVYRRVKDFSKAEQYLTEGLKRILKSDNKYWEAIAYRYFGWYYQEKDDVQNAKNYLTKASKIFESLNAQDDLQTVLNSLAKLSDKKTTYAGIEIGAKGVKGMVVSLSSVDENGFYNTSEKMRKSINTGIISGVANAGEFLDESITETAQAALTLFNIIKNNYAVQEQDIFIVGSSALHSVKNKDKLAQKIKELTGKEIWFITKDDEAYYNIIGSIPDKYQTTALVIDIGSGNTKIGYLEGSDNSSRTIALDVPFGTVSFTDLIQKDIKSDKEFVPAANKLNHSQIAIKLKQEGQKKPAIKNRNTVFMVGGIVWSMATLLHPEKQDSFIRLTSDDITNFYDGLIKNPKKITNPDMSKITDDEWRDNISKQVQSIKDTFSIENLIAGARILKTVSEELRLKDKDIYFSRNGSWLWGYVTSGGVYVEGKKTDKKKTDVKL